MVRNDGPASAFRTAADAGNNDSETPGRRGWFFDVAAFVLGGFVSVIPVGLGLRTFLDPWRRQPRVPKGYASGSDGTGKEGFIRVTSLESLSVGAAPQRFPVIADQIDAWNFTPQQPVGAVFLQRVDKETVRCFNATCPHAGCSVSCDGKGFVCPCHNSTFELDGMRRQAASGRENPSPRNLDDLEVDTEKVEQGEVWVKFQNFYTGKHEKVPKT